VGALIEYQLNHPKNLFKYVQSDTTYVLIDSWKLKKLPLKTSIPLLNGDARVSAYNANTTRHYIPRIPSELNKEENNQKFSGEALKS